MPLNHGSQIGIGECEMGNCALQLMHVQMSNSQFLGGWIHQGGVSSYDVRVSSVGNYSSCSSRFVMLTLSSTSYPIPR